MSTQPASHSPEIDVVKRAFVALSRNDIAGVVKDFDVDIERIEWEGSPAARTYRGIEAVTAHVAEGRATWAEGTCEPERFEVVGDRVVAFTVVHVRLHDATDWIDGRVADVFTFRAGKVIHWQSFLEAREAMEWVGRVSL